MIIEISGISEAMEPVAPGNYPAQITAIEEGESRSGRPMISVEFAIADGPYAGRKLYDRFLKDHPVGLRRFGRLLRAASVQAVGERIDTNDVVGKFVTVTVDHEVNEETGELQERIVKYAVFSAA